MYSPTFWCSARSVPYVGRDDPLSVSLRSARAAGVTQANVHVTVLSLSSTGRVVSILLSVSAPRLRINISGDLFGLGK